MPVMFTLEVMSATMRAVQAAETAVSKVFNWEFVGAEPVYWP
jgi:hypothetical protein